MTGTCLILVCNRAVWCRDRCQAHYEYRRRHGVDNPMPVQAVPIPQRLSIRSPDDPGPRMALDTSTPCILHEGSVTPDGYGKRGDTRTHVEAYEAEYGPVPPGHQVDHVCHNVDPDCPGGATCLHRRCKNPAHLEAVTPRENTLRSKGITAAHARQTHCHKGHEFTPENTFTPKSGWRVCRACRREWQRARYWRLQSEAAA